MYLYINIVDSTNYQQASFQIFKLVQKLLIKCLYLHNTSYFNLKIIFRQVGKLSRSRYKVQISRSRNRQLSSGDGQHVKDRIDEDEEDVEGEEGNDKEVKNSIDGYNKEVDVDNQDINGVKQDEKMGEDQEDGKTEKKREDGEAEKKREDGEAEKNREDGEAVKKREDGEAVKNRENGENVETHDVGSLHGRIVEGREDLVQNG